MIYTNTSKRWTNSLKIRKRKAAAQADELARDGGGRGAAKNGGKRKPDILHHTSVPPHYFVLFITFYTHSHRVKRRRNIVGRNGADVIKGKGLISPCVQETKRVYVTFLCYSMRWYDFTRVLVQLLLVNRFLFLCRLPFAYKMAVRTNTICINLREIMSVCPSPFHQLTELSERIHLLRYYIRFTYDLNLSLFISFLEDFTKISLFPYLYSFPTWKEIENKKFSMTENESIGICLVAQKGGKFIRNEVFFLILVLCLSIHLA